MNFRRPSLTFDFPSHFLVPARQKNECELKTGQRLLGVLPGSGWDNLVNEERGLTTNRELYDLCRVSADGSYLIPDDMIIGE